MVTDVAAEQKKPVFEPNRRAEVCLLLATLLPQDSAHFEQMQDDELVAAIRALPAPLSYTGDTLERVRRLIELLQEATEDRSIKTRTDMEFSMLCWELQWARGDRVMYAVLGTAFGVVMGMLFMSLLR